MKNKAIRLFKKIENLTDVEAELVKEYYQKRPDKIWGEQKSLLKGFSDLPLFASDAEEKQGKLF